MTLKTLLMISVCCIINFPLAAQTLEKKGDNLNSILRHVYEFNPTLRASRAELQAIHELYPQALSGYRPSLTLESNIYSKDINGKSIGRNDGTTTKDMALSLSQPLFRGGRTTAETARANSLIKAGYAALLQGEQVIFLQTITVIADVIRDRALLNLRQNNERLLTEELKSVQARMQAGELTKTDAMQAEARLARAVSEKIAGQGTLDSSIARFQELVGYLPPDTLQFPRLLFTFPATRQSMVALAEQNNPEIQLSIHTHTAADHAVDATFRGLMPQISAFATYSKEYDPQPGGLSDVDAQTFGIRASLALYEGGNTRSRVREAKDTAKQRQIEIEKTKRRIVQMIFSDSNGLIAAQAEILSRTSQINASQIAREGVGAEARLGGRTVLDVLDADQELLDAKAAHIIAQRNEIIRHYSLAADLGLLLPEHIGLSDIAYEPGPHYRAMSKRILSMDPEALN